MRTSNYIPSGNEKAVFTAAWRRSLPVLLKGPTGCGKTRFVQAMTEELARPPVCAQVVPAQMIGVRRFIVSKSTRINRNTQP
jgi:MoxR-like ATPase